MKTCNMCREQLHESCFSRDRKNQDGLNGRCRSCIKRVCDGKREALNAAQRKRWKEQYADPRFRDKRLLQQFKQRERDKKRTLYAAAKHRAKRKGLDFDIDISDLPDIPDRCPFLGSPLIKQRSGRDADYPLADAPSIDRIDPAKGYIKGNVHIVSYRANRAKANLTIDEMRMLVSRWADIIKNGKSVS